MDGTRIDELSKALARGTARRTVLKGLAALPLLGLLGRLGPAEPVLAQASTCAPPGLPSTSLQQKECYKFCGELYPQSGSTLAQFQDCVSQSRCSEGPCFTCGPEAPAGHPDLCGPSPLSPVPGDFCCTAATPNCCSRTCVNLQTDPNNCGRCGHVCTSRNCQGGVCRPNAAGGPCVYGSDCTSLACCNSVTPPCVGPTGPTGVCGAHCVDPTNPANSPCGSNADCTSNNCNQTSHTCQPNAAGGTCLCGGDCQSGFCCTTPGGCHGGTIQQNHCG